ncbi:MAG: hypothetical protein OXU22_02865 [Gammaproteobacteria bacterium]|nr:hypothetical protein [Gammaproteobacteria bacterium]
MIISTGLKVELLMRVATRIKSSMAKIDKIAVALKMLITMPANGGTMTRSACGRITLTQVGNACNPSA